jgi:outer membrane protein assembly factor BamD
VASADRFIKLHPRHQNVDYAYYLRGLARMGEKQDLSSRFLPIQAREPSRRDPTSTREAYEYFNELVQKFPDSRYAPDALARMDRLRNTLAEHEIHVARFYLEHNAYVAAVNRARYVIEQFPTTPASRTAVAILAESYSALGMEDLAADARRVQTLNAPAAEE